MNTDLPVLVHVRPASGRKHVCKGLTCWCKPKRDVKVPTLAVHNAKK
jgi:hypothetical protein